MPAISSHERIGVVISNSRLPRSRSRTIATAVKITMVMFRMTPINAGTTCTAVRRSGLYSVRSWKAGSLASKLGSGSGTACGRAVDSTPSRQRHVGETARDAIGHRLGAVDQQLRDGATCRCSRRRSKSGGYHDADADFAGIEPATQVRDARARREEDDDVARLHVAEQCARMTRPGFIDGGRAQFAHIEIDGVAEQQDLQQRDADDHAERRAIARQLPGLLQHDREYALRPRRTRVVSRPCSRAAHD